MALAPYHHGVRVQEVAGGARNLRTASTSVIGVIAVGTDADVATFPLNQRVLLTDVGAAVGKAGDEDTLAPTLEAIADQTSPAVVVVRVAEGADAAATDLNVKAGIQLLLGAQAEFGVRPRILGAPGLETQAVCTKLAEVAGKLRGMAYASAAQAAADTVAEAITLRDEFAARELMLLWPDFKAGGDTSWASARALGLRARIDEEQGWHKTLSNVALEGVTGLTKDVHWDLQDPSTDAGLLNAAQITTLIRHNGYRFWGSRTCSDDPMFEFESSVRTAQVLQDTIAEGLMWAVDKPLHPSLARDIIETINAKFRALVRAGQLIGASAWLDPAANNPTDLAGGKLVIDYDYTDVPPLEDLTLIQRKTDRYFANFANQVGFG